MDIFIKKESYQSKIPRQLFVVTCSLFIAIGVVLQYIDSLIGGKTGIANIVNIVAIPIFAPIVVFLLDSWWFVLYE